MALIKCRECGKEMSDSAQHCPHCGCQMRTAGTGIDNQTLIKIVAAAGVALVGLILFFSNIGRITDTLRFYDIETLLMAVFEWNDIFSKAIQKAFWLSLVGIAMIVTGVVMGVRCYKQMKYAEKERPSWKCSCGATNFPIAGKCIRCGKSKNGFISDAPSRPAPTGSIPTWQRLEMEREAARKKEEEESKKS